MDIDLDTFLKITGLEVFNSDTMGLWMIIAVIIITMLVASQATKTKQPITPSVSPKSKKYTSHLRKRGKHEFVQRPSILDSGMAILVPWRKDSPRSNLMKQSVFRGWYNLLWIMAIAWLLSYFLENYKTKGSLLSHLSWVYSLFHFLHEFIIIMLPIYGASFSAFFLQKLMAFNVFGRKYTRTILTFVQHCIQTIFIFGIGTFVFLFCEHWPFSQKLSLLLETFVLYMKMHSYLLSNHELYTMKQRTLSNIKQHKKTDNQNNENDYSYYSIDDVDKMDDDSVRMELSKRGLRDYSSFAKDSASPSHFCYYVQKNSNIDVYGFSSCYKGKTTVGYKNSNNHNRTATNQEKNNSSSTNQENNTVSENDNNGQPIKDNNKTAAGTVEDILNGNISSNLKTKNTLKIKSEIHKLREYQAVQLQLAYMRMALKDAIFLENYRKNIYPMNVTFWNWLEFTWLPTLVYEPLYPRTNTVRLLYIFEKVIMTFAILGFMIGLVESFMLKPLSEQSRKAPVETVIKLLVPATMVDVLAFFLVFDCILNTIAEITCFADREFYQDWWNSTSFEEFARKWNKPVHEFLLRHIYYESMNTYKFSKNLAMAGTFIFSIVLHEIVLCACFHRFSPYLAVMSLMQLPLMPIMKSPVFKNKPLGNIVFWSSLMLGAPMASVLYAKDYCVTFDCMSFDK